jgi:hypothetical protein
MPNGTLTWSGELVCGKIPALGPAPSGGAFKRLATDLARPLRRLFGSCGLLAPLRARPASPEAARTFLGLRKGARFQVFGIVAFGNST